MNANPPLTINTQPYANRWIAVVRGQVCGVGTTFQQAERVARQTRPKRKPQLYFIGSNGERMIGQEWLHQNSLLHNVHQILQRHEIEAYLVGGAVRDLLIGHTDIVDLDFAVPTDGLYAARTVANALGGAFYPLDEARGTGRAICNDAAKTHLDFATFRGPDLLSDLADRDFTINAIALRLSETPELLDPFQGQVDLSLGRIQAVSNHSMRNDPARTLRAIRQAVHFDFNIETQTQTQIKQAAAYIAEVSPERQRDELLKLLNHAASASAVQMLADFKLLPLILPEVDALIGIEQSKPHHLDVFHHTLAVLEAWEEIQSWLNDSIQLTELSSSSQAVQLKERYGTSLNRYFEQSLTGDVSLKQLMPLAILLHDTGKAQCQQLDNGRIRFLGHETESVKIASNILKRLRLSRQAATFVQTVVANHMRPLNLSQNSTISRRAIYRFFRDSRVATIQAGPAILLHALADHFGTYPKGAGQAAAATLLQSIKQLLEAYFEQPTQSVTPPLLLSGRDLMQHFDLPQGKLIGNLLNQLREAQAVGDILDREAALNFIKTKLNQEADNRPPV